MLKVPVGTAPTSIFFSAFDLLCLQSSYVHEANAKVEYEVEHVFNASASIQAKKHSVAIFSYILDADEYDVAIESVACYAILRNYTYLLIFENDYWLQKCPQGHVSFISA